MPVPRGRRGAAAPLALLLYTAAGAAGCAVSHPVRPPPAGETVYAASVGGPMVAALDVAFPTPILQVGAARGLAERVAAAANADVTAALYGTAHVEPGVIYYPVVHDRGPLPSLALAGSLHVLTDFEDLLVAPHAAGLVSWAIGRHAVYFGADTALALRTRTRVVAGPLLGAQLRRGRLGLGVELKWLAPWYDTEPLAPSWVSPGGRGYLSVLVGASFHPREAR